MKKHKYIVSFVLVALLIALLAGHRFLLDYWGQRWVESRQEALALPVSGEYWNDELGMHLCFSDGVTTMQYVHGNNEPLDIHPAGRLTNRDGTFNAWYSWDKESDELILTIITNWDAMATDKEYAFISKNI